MSNSTITLQKTLNYASTHGDLLPLANVGGFTDEPGLTICNDALSDLISDPNDWKVNRNDMPVLFTCPNKQDQLFAGACIFTLNSTATPPAPGWASQGWGIDLASNNGITVTGGNVTVKTLETHRIPVGASVFITGVTALTGNAATADNYNSVFTDTGTSSGWSTSWTVTSITGKTIVFAATTGQNTGDVLGAPGITNYGYLTSAAYQELNNTSSPPNLQPCTVYRELPKVSRVANPDSLCVLTDLGTGVLRIRHHMVPSNTVWGALMVYQAKAPLKVALTDTWAPFPDNLQAVINQAVLYRMYRYLNDPKADSEYKKLQAAIAKIHGVDQTEETDVHLQPEESLMDNSYWGWW